MALPLRDASRYCALLVGLLTAGCVSTSGQMGPIAWRAVDASVVNGERAAAYECSLVLREVSGKSITFTKITRTLGTSRDDEFVSVELPAHGELRLRFAWSGGCLGVCSAQKAGSVIWNVALVGTDQDGQDIRIAFDFITPLVEDVTVGVRTPKDR